jgi:hypothetical protein
MASSAAASSSAADAASTSDAHGGRRWTEQPAARQIVATAMAEVVENAKMDLLPTIDNSRLLGLYSTDPNVEVARYA